MAERDVLQARGAMLAGVDDDAEDGRNTVRNLLQYLPDHRAGARLQMDSRWGDSVLEPDTVKWNRLDRLALAAVVCAASIVSSTSAYAAGLIGLGGSGTLVDRVADAVPRRTDAGATLAFDTNAHRLPDLVKIRLTGFSPFDASTDLFDGTTLPFETDADFFRLDIVINGLVNPPGSVDPTGYAPFEYGDNPVYGFIELDMDDDVSTGGELEAPQYRYLGNVVRFGGKPGNEELHDRVAVDASAFDGNFTTAPQVERSGEEFHLALHGADFLPGDIQVIVGDGNGTFDAGETWWITAAFFHRAHGFAPFSFIKGGLHAGEYQPESTLQFAHDVTTDETVISLVFPLTQVGAALISGGPVENLDLDPTNQASVEEALSDLTLSADFLVKNPTGDPEEAILVGWTERDAESYLDTEDWRVTAILGSAYTESSPNRVHYLWSDVFPDVLLGDVDGDEEFDADDRDLISGYIASMDASDGTVDGKVEIAGFADNFSLFDVNHDGMVSAFDLVVNQADGDSDGDKDIDLNDFAVFQRCFAFDSSLVPGCITMDLDIDGMVGLNDLKKMSVLLVGPR